MYPISRFIPCALPVLCTGGGHAQAAKQAIAYAAFLLPWRKKVELLPSMPCMWGMPVESNELLPLPRSGAIDFAARMGSPTIGFEYNRNVVSPPWKW